MMLFSLLTGARERPQGEGEGELVEEGKECAWAAGGTTRRCPGSSRAWTSTSWRTAAAAARRARTRRGPPSSTMAGRPCPSSSVRAPLAISSLSLARVVCGWQWRWWWWRVKLNCARLLAHASILRAGNETFEKLGTLGTSANLLVYLTQVFHMRSVDAATLLNGLNGTTSLAPIIGAFLSDAYLGRYLALAIASVASLIVSTTAISSTGPSLLYIYIYIYFLPYYYFICDVRRPCRRPEPGRPAGGESDFGRGVGGWLEFCGRAGG